MSSVLLIGGSGFFGKSFLDSFQRGLLDKWKVDHVIAMARHADELRSKATQLLDSRVEILNADIGTAKTLPDADYVIHAAASTDARNYNSRSEAERKNIQAGVANYCKLASKFHMNSKIVYVSSGAIYGVQPRDVAYLDESMASFDLEKMPQHKKSYALAKRMGEKAFKDLCAEQGISASVARCFAFIGPWLPRDQHFAIGNFIQDGLAGQAIKVNANHPVYRSYMHSDDLVQWLMGLAENANPSCEEFNVGSMESVSIFELAQKVSKLFSVPLCAPKQEEGYIDRYVPSTKKAEDMFGFKTSINLDDALERTVNELLSRQT